MKKDWLRYSAGIGLMVAPIAWFVLWFPADGVAWLVGVFLCLVSMLVGLFMNMRAADRLDVSPAWAWMLFPEALFVARPRRWQEAAGEVASPSNPGALPMDDSPSDKDS